MVQVSSPEGFLRFDADAERGFQPARLKQSTDVMRPGLGNRKLIPPDRAVAVGVGGFDFEFQPACSIGLDPRGKGRPFADFELPVKADAFEHRGIHRRGFRQSQPVQHRQAGEKRE